MGPVPDHGFVDRLRRVGATVAFLTRDQADAWLESPLEEGELRHRVRCLVLDTHDTALAARLRQRFDVPRILGGRFIGHGGGKFTMRIDDKDHPVMATMDDFEITDETYRDKYHPDFKLHSLGHIDRGKEQQSMIWAQQYGKGRVFNTTLGHGKEAFNNPALQRMIVRGLYWTTGRKPKDPPSN